MLIVPSGCITSTTESEVEDPLRDARATAELSEQQAQEHDFGTILASGRTLRHTFRLTNPTDHPIRLLRAATSTPCCSAIGPLPKSIPAGGAVQVPTIVRTENKVGHLRIAFAVETDSPVIPIRRLTVSASLIPEWEVVTTREPIESLPLGQPGTLSYKIYCRRRGAEGLDLPSRITTTGPIKLLATGSADEAVGPGGVVEATREFQVELVASTEAGRHQAEVVFQWADGRSRSHIVAWGIRPLVNVTPSGLVIQRSKEPTAVALSVVSDDRPIRIIKVDGPLAEPFASPTRASRRHPLSLLVDTSRAAGGGLADIRMTTDHPAQPIVSAPILITASGEGDNR